VVDGSNIATEGRSFPSLAQLDEAVVDFLKEHHFDNVIVVVDATFAHRIDQSEREAYEAAILAGEILTPPAGAVGRGDAFVLQIAERADATVLSNDSFQEFHGSHPWLFEGGRLWGGKPVPALGWVYVARNPVKGPTSRRSVKEAKDKTVPGKERAVRGGTSSGVKLGPPPKPSASNPPPSPKQRTKSTEPVNEPPVYMSFAVSHAPGTTVDATVVEFSSHGAYVEADGARCYVPLKAMGDPVPRSAREVLAMGEVRSFVVERFDSPRRSIDLALPGFEKVMENAGSSVTLGEANDETVGGPQRSRPRAEEEALSKK
jgi:hypothetical protein